MLYSRRKSFFKMIIHYLSISFEKLALRVKNAISTLIFQIFLTSFQCFHQALPEKSHKFLMQAFLQTLEPWGVVRLFLFYKEIFLSSWLIVKNFCQPYQFFVGWKMYQMIHLSARWLFLVLMILMPIRDILYMGLQDAKSGLCKYIPHFI